MYDEPLLIAAGKESRWARRRQIELAELIDEPWVLPQPNSQVALLIAELFRSAGLDWPKNGVVCSSLQMNEALLATGRYLAWYPGSFLKLNAHRQSIKALPVRLAKRSMPVGIVTLKNRTLSPIAELFAEEARKTTKGLGKILWPMLSLPRPERHIVALRAMSLGSQSLQVDFARVAGSDRNHPKADLIPMP